MTQTSSPTQAAFELLADTEAVATRVAAIIRHYLTRTADPVLGWATGETFRPVYRQLIRDHRAGAVSFAQAVHFNLDEYVGLGPDHPAAFRTAMRTALFDHVDAAPEHIHLPNGSAPDLDEEAARYEALIKRAGGIGLQLLGIGRNGHIGFNEPGSSFEGRTRVVRLAASTREANRAAFPPGCPVPERAITMGIGTILEARSIVLVATGAAKAPALAAALNGPVSPACPASALRVHPAVRVLADREAAARLALAA